MKIQYITYSSEPLLNHPELTITTFTAPRSLDEFDINIISLNHPGMWKNKPNTVDSVDCIKDLQHLSRMIHQRSKSKIVILYPQNTEFKCGYYTSVGKKYYQTYEQLKNILSLISTQIINKVFSLPVIPLMYENTKTRIGQDNIDSCFYFVVSDKTLTYSIASEKATTITANNVVLTTLSLPTGNDILSFLKHIGLLENKCSIPEWFNELEMFDDNQLKENISINHKRIEAIELEITDAQSKLCINNELKSILYTNGDELVRVVFKILTYMLDCDLTQFIDEKKEDFSFPIEDVQIIGEIKGVTSNVKSEHISQVDVHLQSYNDKHTAGDNSHRSKSKAVLIVNHQRNSDIWGRQPVHTTQIQLAKRNDCLIIETITLLKLYEDLRTGKVSKSQIKYALINQTGLLQSVF